MGGVSPEPKVELWSIYEPEQAVLVEPQPQKSSEKQIDSEPGRQSESGAQREFAPGLASVPVHSERPHGLELEPGHELEIAAEPELGQRLGRSHDLLLGQKPGFEPAQHPEPRPPDTGRVPERNPGQYSQREPGDGLGL